ncbi:MAG: SDR family NAD(P)-dependent oxidoreductase [Pseudomonadota bacterium]
MSKFAGKTAIISGGAEGIGFAIARALGQQKMNIVLADIDVATLDKAVHELNQAGITAIGTKLDVAEESDWEAVAARALGEFGEIHMLVNNAGVGGEPGPIEHQSIQGWMWGLSVNLMGVVYGVKTMIPHIKQHGDGGWLLNVASMAGMGGVPYSGVYTASKSAVVALTEAWAAELGSDDIHVSVLCPGFVHTRIYASGRNRQARFESHAPVSPQAEQRKNSAAELVKNGIDPSIVGQRVIEALNAGELYIFTHAKYRDVIQQRSSAIDEAFARAEQSPILRDVVSSDML